MSTFNNENQSPSEQGLSDKSKWDNQHQRKVQIVETVMFQQTQLLQSGFIMDGDIAKQIRHEIKVLEEKKISIRKAAVEAMILTEQRKNGEGLRSKADATENDGDNGSGLLCHIDYRPLCFSDTEKLKRQKLRLLKQARIEAHLKQTEEAEPKADSNQALAGPNKKEIVKTLGPIKNAPEKYYNDCKIYQHSKNSKILSCRDVELEVLGLPSKRGLNYFAGFQGAPQCHNVGYSPMDQKVFSYCGGRDAGAKRQTDKEKVSWHRGSAASGGSIKVNYKPNGLHHATKHLNRSRSVIKRRYCINELKQLHHNAGLMKGKRN